MARIATAKRHASDTAGTGIGYEDDLVLWADEQVRLIHMRALDRLDLEHLAEEIADLGGSLKREVESRTQTLLEHLLKLHASPSAAPRRKWIETVKRTRIEIRRCLKQAPSLRRSLAGALSDVQADAIDLAVASFAAADEVDAATVLALRNASFTVDQVFGDWIPGE